MERKAEVKEQRTSKGNLHMKIKEMLLDTAQTLLQQTRAMERQPDWRIQCGTRPGGAHRGQKSIPLPLLSFVVFVPLLPGAPPPPDGASPENGLRCGAALVCCATAGS